MFSSNSDGFLVSEFFDFPLGPVFDGIRFMIKVLFEFGKGGHVECWFLQTSTHVCHLIARCSVTVISTISAAAGAGTVTV